VARLDPCAVVRFPPINGKANILACYFASYGKNKIRAAIPTSHGDHVSEVTRLVKVRVSTTAAQACG
jgi:hypothetical protein